MKNREEAINSFSRMNCNQAILCTYGPKFGVDESTCLKLGMAYGGGIGRTGRTCGAVTGAYTIIGLWSAEQKVEDLAETKKIAYEKVQEFDRLFLKENGSLECKDLLKYDLSIPEESDKAIELNLFDTVCPKMVGSSADILDVILK